MTARVVFLGSPDFAVPSLQRLQSAHLVELVVTQPDRPAGRGRHLEPTPVHDAARALGLPILTYEKSARADLEARLAKLHPDVLVVVAFGHILKPTMLAAARRGAINVHASLLPRWRGVAPIERALAAGDAVTGVTLMQLDAGVDTGPMLAQRIVPIAPDDTRVSLRQRLAAEGAALLAEHLVAYVSGVLAAQSQPEVGATYAPRLAKEEGRVVWERDVLEIWNQVRAFAEWPGAVTTLRGTVLKLHTVRPLDLLVHAEPGTVLRADARAVHVACGRGTLELLEVQLAGKSRVGARDLVAGRVLRAGDRLGT